MKLSVRFTKTARADLAEIYRFIKRRDGAERAKGVLKRIVESTQMLASQPGADPIPPELEPLGLTEYRQLVSAPYRVVYSVEGDTVYVMVVADGRRDFQSLLKRRMLQIG